MGMWEMEEGGRVLRNVKDGVEASAKTTLAFMD